MGLVLSRWWYARRHGNVRYLGDESDSSLSLSDSEGDGISLSDSSSPINGDLNGFAHYPEVCLSGCLSVCPSVRLSVCLSVCLFSSDIQLVVRSS